MIAAPARPGRWLDTSVICSTEVLRAAAAHGYGGVVRYVPLPRNGGERDISAAELERIVAADLQCALVQHVRMPGWHPSLCSGLEDADTAADWAMHAAYPQGCHIFLDIEGVGGTDIPTANFINEWAHELIGAGYLAGLYVGYGVPLTPDELYALPDIHCYWSDAGHRRISHRGCSIVQGELVRIQGTEFDEDIVAPDALGGLPYVATPEVLAA